jgi:hypothetical protein
LIISKKAETEVKCPFEGINFNHQNAPGQTGDFQVMCRKRDFKRKQ